ncbi:hypothetical protein [Pantoea sp. RHCKP32]|uniref:hypothetical protein n=1 Tax=Pantoea sp. RHCKP32 TaxID=3425182 RepID=UPI003DA015F8
MKKSAILITALLLTGCSTAVVPPGEAITAPNDRVFKYQSSSAGDSALTIIRDSGMIGAGCFATVYINGERVAKLNPKEKATFYLPTGEWAIGANVEGNGLCAFSGERQERYISLKSGEHKAARVFTGDDGVMDIRPTTLD